MISENRLTEVINNFSDIGPLLVLGDIGVDKYTMGEVTRISPEAPVPIVEVYKEWNKLGLAANVTDNLRSLGVKATTCGVIGNDIHGNIFENLLEEHELSTWGVIRCDDRSTIFKERVVTNIQQVCRVDYESKDAISLETHDRIKHRINEFDGIHQGVIIEDYGKGLLSEDLAQFLIKRAKEKKQIIAIDPSRSTPPHWYKGANILKPNKAESLCMVKALGYNSETDMPKIAKILLEELALEKVIITLGSEGMLICTNDNPDNFTIIPTFAREVFDVSGAGDTAISTIVASIIAGASIEEAVWIGNIASGVVVGKKGTALASIDEIKDFYQYSKTHMH